jgi:bifunctional non-homologous end joining protein LigD
VIDGEAVILGVDGVADFNALHSGKHNEEVQLFAFDILALDGDDLRRMPLSIRKTNLARILRGRPDDVFAAPFQQATSPPTYSARLATWGSRKDRPYEAGRSKHWIKENRTHPAMDRVLPAAIAAYINGTIDAWLIASRRKVSRTDTGESERLKSG